VAGAAGAAGASGAAGAAGAASVGAPIGTAAPSQPQAGAAAPQPQAASQPHDGSAAQPHDGSQAGAAQPHDGSGAQQGSGSQQAGLQHLRAFMRANKPPPHLCFLPHFGAGSQHEGSGSQQAGLLHLRPNRPAVACCSSPIIANPTRATSTATVDMTTRFIFKLLPNSKGTTQFHTLTVASHSVPNSAATVFGGGATLYRYS
jgi:hypothetical protein